MISFQDSAQHSFTSQRTCFESLQAACSQARDLHLHWIWNDGICIDRCSSIAISDCLNSIGDIYRDCSLCIVHLQDFPTWVITKEERGLCLENCSWTRNAWTLPHLILPQEAYFYDSRWTHIGRKSSLAAQLSHLMGIEAGVLYNRNALLEYSVAKRVSWASGRRAPCVEDEAYSLLSFFGVNMSIQCGEGRRNFLRLQGEILEKTKDCSLFAWQSLEVLKSRGIRARCPAEYRHFKRGPKQPFRMKDYFRFERDGIAIDTERSEEDFCIPLYGENEYKCSVELSYEEGQFVRGSPHTLRTHDHSPNSKFHEIWINLDVGCCSCLGLNERGKT